MATFVIMGNGYWAHGEDLASAKRKFTSVGGRLSLGYGIFEFDDDTDFLGVDSMGYYEWKGNPPIKSVVAARKGARR